LKAGDKNGSDHSQELTVKPGMKRFLIRTESRKARTNTRTTMNNAHASSQCHLKPMRKVICSLCILISAASFAAAQETQEPPAPGTTLKITSEVVNVYAVVRGKNGRLVPDLTKADFELQEDQQPQVITYFSKATDTPLTMGILVDTSPSQGEVLDVEKREAEAFLEEVMRPKDLTFVLHFDVEVELLQDFTADLHLLNKAIDETEINGGGVRTTGTFPSGDAGGATHLYDAVYLSARELLKNEVGRKVLILLTDGEDQGSKVKLDTALEAAQKADIIIYSIDISDAAFYHHQGMGYNGEPILRKLSEETGGRVIQVKNESDTSAAFQHIANELRTQYLLGYTPTNSKLDGTFRKITVKVPTKEVKVNARRGYYAPQG
jgi:VWFA-related protein